MTLLLLLHLADAWSVGHVLTSTEAFKYQPDEFRALFRATNVSLLGVTSTAAAFLTNGFGLKSLHAWSEIPDRIAGPCEAGMHGPCTSIEIESKLLYREYCYAENASAAFVKPWPYAIPACNHSSSDHDPACLPGPRTWPWMYHYFNHTPPENAGIEARGAAWYIASAATALRAGNLSAAGLHLGCFAHALQDRSSPYHAWGGHEDARAATEARLRTIETCEQRRRESNSSLAFKLCEIKFWSPGDASEAAVQWGVPGGSYTPSLLGGSAEAAGAAVGTRLQALAAGSRALMARPGTGYEATHLRDDSWWADIPPKASEATLGALSLMAVQSTKLVADAWLTAWRLAHDLAASLALAAPPRRPTPSAAALSEWERRAAEAAEADLAEGLLDEPAASASRNAAPLLVAVAPGASPPEANAASLLASILGAAGLETKRVTPGAAVGLPHVALGLGAALAADVSREALAGMRADDYFCRAAAAPSATAAPGVLVLTGGADGQPRGALNGVFELLRTLGYRNFAPDGTGPLLPTNLSVASVLHPPSSARCSAAGAIVRPSVAVRNLNGFRTGPFHRDAVDSTFAVANHINGAMSQAWALNASFGGSSFYSGGFVHTSFELVPPCTNYDPSRPCFSNDTAALNRTHPEWFGGWLGPLHPDSGQLCWMNETMQDYLIMSVRKLLESHPDADTISISQQDHNGYCTRPADQAVIDEEGSPMAPLLRALNVVGANISADYPHVNISTLSYHYTRPLPKTTRPRPNVVIRLCNINADFGAPLDAPANADFLTDFRAWRNATADGQLHIWTYAANFENFVVPFPDWSVIGPNMAFFAAHGVSSVFIEATQSYPIAGMDELRTWVAASLLWDGSRDPAALVDEFLVGYYGAAAAPHVARHMAAYENATRSGGDGGYVRDGCRWGPDAREVQLPTRDCFLLPWLTDYAVMGSAEALSAALAAAGGLGSGVHATRVERVWISTQWVLLNRWAELCLFATAQRPPLEWPANRTMAGAVHELVAALGRQNITWLAPPLYAPGWNASSLLTTFDMTLKCN